MEVIALKYNFLSIKSTFVVLKSIYFQEKGFSEIMAIHQE